MRIVDEENTGEGTDPRQGRSCAARLVRHECHAALWPGEFWPSLLVSFFTLSINALPLATKGRLLKYPEAMQDKT